MEIEAGFDENTKEEAQSKAEDRTGQVFVNGELETKTKRRGEEIQIVIDGHYEGVVTGKHEAKTKRLLG